jgi:hypothetical protein
MTRSGMKPVSGASIRHPDRCLATALAVLL